MGEVADLSNGREDVFGDTKGVASSSGRRVGGARRWRRIGKGQCDCLSPSLLLMPEAPEKHERQTMMDEGQQTNFPPLKVR